MNNIKLSKSCIGSKEKDAVMKVLDRGYLGMGEEVKAFEEELSNFFNRTAVCVTNGTAALQLALEALNIMPGDEVLVQSITYVASFQAITAAGAIPIACDIDPMTLTIDLADAKSKLSSNTKVIMPVHYAGGVGNLKAIYKFAEQNGLRVVEDAAHAFGTKYKNKKIGSFGDIACFSFDGIKNITSGEGGCIVTEDQQVIDRVKDSRLLGVQKDTEKRYEGSRSWDPDVTHQGWRYHMSDIMAAIGRVQLANFEYHKLSRQRLAKYYSKKLKDVNEVSLIDLDFNEVVPHIFVIKLNAKIDRKKLIENLEKESIPVGIHYKPNHHLTFFKNLNDSHLRNTENTFSSILTLPLHPEITEQDIDLIIPSLLKGMENAK